jgi:cerevisin
MYLIYGLLFSYINSELILIPKQKTKSLINVNSFANEHNMNSFATINDNTFYKMKRGIYDIYANTINDLFYVEKEQIYRVGDIDNKENIITQSYDNKVSGFLTFESSVPWHLDRISKKNLPLDGTYKYDTSGSCLKNKDIQVDTYIIDTGIDVEHPEFEDRATWLENFIDSKDRDCHSHGTHCAGLVGSKTYGVCKDARLFAIKVLDCDGSGSTSSVISGIEHAYKRHLLRIEETGGKVRSVISMSLGGGFSRALNMAVKSTLKSPTFYFAAAAGNEDTNSCESSPASVKEIFTVMASDKFDTRASFSNYDKCADIYSPGVNIISTIPDNGHAVYSGTSMATPILVGVMNHYIDMYPKLDMKQLKKKILHSSTKGVISKNPPNTSNVIPYLYRENENV